MWPLKQLIEQQQAELKMRVQRERALFSSTVNLAVKYRTLQDCGEEDRKIT